MQRAIRRAARLDGRSVSGWVRKILGDAADLALRFEAGADAPGSPPPPHA